MVRLPSPWSPVEARRAVAAAPEVVFDVLADPRTYPDWLVGAQRIRSVDPSFPAPGAQFEHSVGATEAATVDDVTEVRAVDRPRRLRLLVHAGAFHGDVELLVEPRADGSEVRFRERPVGWAAALTPVLRTVLHGRNAESLRRLADLVEPEVGEP